MKLLGTVNLWNHDQWVYCWYPANVFSVRKRWSSAYGGGSQIIVTLFGFVFFVEIGEPESDC